MKRGDIVAVAAKGDYTGKPRPALIVQSNLFADIPSLALCLISRDMTDAPLLRIPVEPKAGNGLRQPCQIMVDKLVTVPKDKIGKRIGTLDKALMLAVDRSLALFLGLA